jgi:hypothetical protein
MVVAATNNIAVDIEKAIENSQKDGAAWDAAKTRMWHFGKNRLRKMVEINLHGSWGFYVHAGMLTNMAYVYLSLNHSDHGCKAFRANMALVRCSALVFSNILTGNVTAAMELGQVLIPMFLTLCILAPLFVLNGQMVRIEILAARKRAEVSSTDPQSKALVEFSDFTTQQSYRAKFITGNSVTIGSFISFIGLVDYILPQLRD